jgi:transcriptional regulator with XRE-family HTH domain
VIPISNRQLRAARALLGWSQLVLAERAGVSPITVKRLEASDAGFAARVATLTNVQTALEAAGVVFLAPVPGFRDGVQVRTAPVGDSVPPPPEQRSARGPVGRRVGSGGSAADVRSAQ